MDLKVVEVDAQRVMKVARQTHKDTGVKKKKVGEPTKQPHNQPANQLLAKQSSVNHQAYI